MKLGVVFLRIPLIPPEQPILADDAPGDMAGEAGEKKKTDTQRRKTRRTDTLKKGCEQINHWHFPGADLQAASHVVFRRVFKYLSDFFPAISERISVKAPWARQWAVCWALESK